MARHTCSMTCRCFFLHTLNELDVFPLLDLQRQIERSDWEVNCLREHFANLAQEVQHDFALLSHEARQKLRNPRQPLQRWNLRRVFFYRFGKETSIVVVRQEPKYLQKFCIKKLVLEKYCSKLTLARYLRDLLSF